nr:ABC transporter permease subunit [Tissierella sp.]
MNIIKRELKSNLKSLMLWSLGIIFLISIWMIEYESFAGSPAINDILDSMPSSLLDAMGMGNMDLSSVAGFLSALSLYLYLILGIHAVLLGSSIIAKEERDRTAEYLFALPVSRISIIRSKTIAAVINIIVLNLITAAVVIVTSMNYQKDESFYKFLGLLFIAVFLFQMIFLSIGMLVASINKKYRRSGNISVSILMISFIIASLVNMIEKLDFLKYITPFKFFDSDIILEEMRLEPVFILISILIIAVGLGGTFIYYPRRDLNI